MSLRLGLMFDDQLEPVVRDELVQLVGTIQQWANALELGRNNIKLSGMGTFFGQPCCKLFKHATEAIPDGIETVVTWEPSPATVSLEGYDDFSMFDGSQYIICSEPGIYIAIAEMQWAANATGVRVVGIHPLIPAVDYFTQSRHLGTAGEGPRHLVTSVFRVIDSATLDAATASYVPFPLQVGVMVFQNSGGPLNIGAINDRFGVWKVS